MNTSLLAPVCGLLILASGCLSGPTFLKQPKATLRDNRTPSKAASVLSDTNGVVTASVVPSATETQTVGASPGSAIAGTVVAFPPGSLAIATNISVEEGAPLASAGFTQQL